MEHSLITLKAVCRAEPRFLKRMLHCISCIQRHEEERCESFARMCLP